MGYVVDANVCAKWFFHEEHQEPARRFADSDNRLLAPDLLPAELGSIIWKKCVPGEITGPQGSRMIALVRRAEVELTPATDLAASALAIGLDLRHSFYDCLYLALARARRVPLVTADRKLHDRVASSPYAALTLWVEDVP